MVYFCMDFMKGVHKRNKSILCDMIMKLIVENVKKKFDKKEVLKGILETDEGSSYLGEAALVDISSPIAKTNKIFLNTLIDENSCCHLALGQSFGECLVDGLQKNREELKELGLNQSKNHVDFFIGTEDLLIEAILKNGEMHLPKRKYGSMSRSRLFTRTNISRTTVQPAKISILSA